MAEKLPWSISTTVRNPERLFPFLRVLKELEGVDFTKDTQMKYQILLIKERVYTPTDIPQRHRTLFDDITQEIPYDIAKEVFEYQDYVDPDMRGRQSVNPLNKLGFTIARAGSGHIHITKFRNRFSAGDYNISFVFFN